MILVLEKFVVYFNDFDEEKKTFPLGVPSNPLLQEMELETEKSTQLKASCTLTNIDDITALPWQQVL